MKVLIAIALILIVVGSLGAQQAQAPTYAAPALPAVLTATDVANMGTADSNIVTGITARDNLILQHDQRIWNLEQQIAQLQAQVAALTPQTVPQPPAPTWLINPTLVAGSGVISGSLITQTNPGTVYNWAFSAPAKTYTITITGAGPGSLQPLVNGAQMGSALKFPAATLGAQSVLINWPGGAGSIGFAWSGGWANVQTTLTVQ